MWQQLDKEDYYASKMTELEASLEAERTTKRILRDTYEKLELELASTKKMLDEAKGLKSVLQSMWQDAESELDEAKEVIGFYADKDRWYQNMGTVITPHGAKPNLSGDLDERMIGGKRAREFLAKHEKKGGV